MRIVTLKYKVITQSELTQQDLQLWRSWIQSAPIPNPLNDPDYFSCIQHPSKPFRIAVGTDDGSPFFYLPFQENGREGLEPVAFEVSDCSQFVTRPDCNLDPIRMIKGIGYSNYSFDHLFEIDAFQPSDYSFYEDDCFLLDLSKGGTGYQQDLNSGGSSIVSQTARKRRKLEREVGEVRFVWDVDDPQALSKLLNWKISQLERQGFQHSFAEDWVQEFMRRHLQSKSKYSRGLLSGLYAGQELVALHFGTVGFGTLNSWIPIVNPDFSRYSPAAMLYLEMAQQAAAREVIRIILGRGENQTKRRLSNCTVPNYVGAFQTGLVNRVRFFGVKCLYRFFRSRWGKGIHHSLRRIRRRISRN